MEAAFPTVEELTLRAWRLEADGWLVSPYMTLLNNGEVAGDYCANAVAWSFDNGRLAIKDNASRTTLTFSEVGSVDGAFALSTFHADGQRYTLQEIDAVRRLARPDPALRLTRRVPGPRRRNLVVLRAGVGATNPPWTRDIAESDRTWDLCASIYAGDVPGPNEAFPEYYVEQRQDRKWEAIYKLMHSESEIWDYDYVTFPDDDLWMKFNDLNRLFEICRIYQLDLAQPALTPDSYVSYHETVQKKDFLLRYVSQVEPMMPVFSREGLRRCAPTFGLQRNGYGIDYVWFKLLGRARNRTAIVDQVAVVHTRPIGVSYDRDIDMADAERLQARFGKGDFFKIKEFGGIYADASSA